MGLILSTPIFNKFFYKRNRATMPTHFPIRTVFLLANIYFSNVFIFCKNCQCNLSCFFIRLTKSFFSHFIFYIQAPDLQRNSGKQKTRESCLHITLIHKIRIQNPLGNSYRTLDYILKVQKMHKKQGIFAQNDGVKRQFTH